MCKIKKLEMKLKINFHLIILMKKWNFSSTVSVKLVKVTLFKFFSLFFIEYNSTTRALTLYNPSEVNAI